MTADMPPQVVAACNQEERLAALRRYGILDTEPEPAFDDITRLIAHVCQTPMATVTFIDRHRQWFKSEIGMGVRETPLDLSICAHAILRNDLYVIHDTLEDEHFRNNPIVAGKPHLRFYAGARLMSPDGQALGTLCVLDYVPRSLTAEQQDALRALARQVVTQLELRQSLAAQVAAAEALRAAKQAAELANRAKDEFLATLSHELRTPLSAILLWADILCRRDARPEQVGEGLATILASARVQKRLIEDLLDTSGIAAGKLHLQLQDVDPAALVREAVEGILPDARRKGVAVEADVAADAGLVSADPVRLRQVLWNLLSNAVKFTPAGGRVAVALRAVDRSVRLTVADTGEGIDAAFLPHVFEAFRQAEGSTRRQHGGLGLGLAIARKLVELHRGTLQAASPGIGRGATFTMHIPLRNAGPPAADDKAALDAADADDAADAVEPDLSGTRVLLVDDDAATRTALAAVLRRAGATVRAVDSAAAALAAFTQSAPDVLLSDIGLPDADGYALIRRIRRSEAEAGVRTPAVAVTAYASSRDHQTALEAGFDTHLPKPIDGDELVEVIANLAAAAKRRYT